jgi:hypothetical protein
MFRPSFPFHAGALCAALVLAGCASKQPTLIVEAPDPAPLACVPPQAGSPLVGIWLAVSRPKGVAGDYQTLTVLQPDGHMSYETQLRVGRKIRPALREAGCWSVADGIYTMQTIVSNGEKVDLSDPIYLNRYRIEKIDKARLTLRDLKQGGQVVVAQRMPSGYRLPF